MSSGGFGLAGFHCAHAPEDFFADALTFLARVDPEPPETTPQIGDTFAMESPVAACSGPAHLLGHLCLRLARCWLQHAPLSLQPALPPPDLGQLARLCHPCTALYRQQHLQRAVSVSAWLVEGLTPHLPALTPNPAG